jgi:hypothetical protein
LISEYLFDKSRIKKMKSFSLNHINETEFEEFCYCLLSELGFTNIIWRKGTGLSSSPSDQGRDIECQFERRDVDGNIFLERWFIECKHYLTGVPPEKIQGALAWSVAENPDVVLFIASNFLSNSTKSFIKTYERENKPRFKIKVWELPDLEKLTIGKSRLLRKFAITGEFSYLSVLHPAHLIYTKGIHFNTLSFLFEIFDDLDVSRRDEVLSWIYEPIIRPRYRKPISDNESLRELRLDEVSYSIFKSKCYEIIKTNTIDEYLLVFIIVNFVLQCQIGISDSTSVDESIFRMKDAIKFFQIKLQETHEEEKRETLVNIIRQTEERILVAHESTEINYKLYEYFCDSVVKKLLLEDIFRNTS